MAKDRLKDDRWYYSFLPYNISGGSTNALIPLFITEGLKGTVAQVGIVSAATSLASVPAGILWGNLSDTSKRRVPFVLAGFLGVAFSLILMGLSQSISEYYIANFIFGFLGAAIAPVGTVMVLECFRKDEWPKRLGDFSKVGGIGWVIGLLLGTLWLMAFPSDGDANPMRALFILAGALGFLSVFLGWRYMKEPLEKLSRHQFPPIELLKVPSYLMEKIRFMPQRLLYVVEMSQKNLRLRNFPSNLRRYYAVVFLAFTGFLCFYVALPTYLARQVGMSSAEVFAVYLSSSFVSALLYSKAGMLVERYGGRKVQALAFGLRVLIFPSFFLVTLLPLELGGVLALMCVLSGLAGMCWALLAVAGDSLVARMSYRSFRSQSMGMYSSVRGVSTIAGSLLGGLVAQYFGYEALFLLSSLFIICAILLLFSTNVEVVTDDPHPEDGLEQ
ncbi:MAG TPA: MFS transporter [Methanomassiliicoccales archaeon]|nr:MFS transporter [Methanomassiliicoccales archaeon]